jgi:hypothetical protein
VRQHVVPRVPVSSSRRMTFYSKNEDLDTRL